MDWKNQLTKTPYLVLFIILITVGVGTASALAVYTFEGLTVFKENSQFDKDVNIDGTISGVETLEGLNCTTEEGARWNGTSWVCGKFTVKINPNTIVDSDEDGFDHTSIAIGSDNNPVISYYNATNGALKVAHCGNASCSSGNTLTIVDDQAGSGTYTSIAIGLDNNPVISYHDDVNDSIKVLHCGNPSCTSGNIKLPLVQGGPDDLGKHTSIAIGTDGNPMISFMDATNDLLKVVACGEPE